MIELKITVETADELSAALSSLSGLYACTTQDCAKEIQQIADAVEKPKTAPVPEAVPEAVPAPVPEAVPAPVPEAVPEPVPEPVPAPEQSYTIDQIAKAGVKLIDAGKTSDLQAILAAYGVRSLAQIPQDKYSDVASRLIALGVEV